MKNKGQHPLKTKGRWPLFSLCALPEAAVLLTELPAEGSNPSRSTIQINAPNQHANARPGQESITAEAAMNPQIHYPASRLWIQGEIHRDLPQLQSRVQAVW